MFESSSIWSAVLDNWPVWAVTVMMIIGAVIDGWALKVPNWVTFPMVISGWVYSSVAFGWEGLGWSLLGTVVAMMMLLPAYSIGGMGAGDVKLFAGVGAWMWSSVAFYAFCVSAVVGGILAVAMVLWSRTWEKHSAQFWMILNEIVTIRDPEKLSQIAAERKSSMRLLPYGVPLTIGTILYFAWTGMLI